MNLFNFTAHFGSEKACRLHFNEERDKKSIVFTNKNTSYIDISKFVELHITEKSNKATTKETLKMGSYNNEQYKEPFVRKLS